MTDTEDWGLMVRSYKDALEELNGVSKATLQTEGDGVITVKYLKGGSPETVQETLEDMVGELDLEVMEYERTWTSVELTFGRAGYWSLPDQWTGGDDS